VQELLYIDKGTVPWDNKGQNIICDTASISRENNEAFNRTGKKIGVFRSVVSRSFNPISWKNLIFFLSNQFIFPVLQIRMILIGFGSCFTGLFVFGFGSKSNFSNRTKSSKKCSATRTVSCHSFYPSLFGLKYCLHYFRRKNVFVKKKLFFSIIETERLLFKPLLK